ncbi:MAG: metallophosphoesterase [Saprospiraceae bacterium]
MMKNIGTLSGKVLVFGGVYSNLESLTVLKAIAEREQIPPQNIVCTGDVVAYCADASACVELVRNWGIHVIAGNVELQLRRGAEDCGCEFNENSRCDIFSRNWYAYAQKQLTSADLDWMQTLPDFITFQYANRKVTVVHGSYHHVSEYVFASTDWIVKERNFVDTESDVILAGHCGLPFSEERDGKLWLNSGVIGMPANDGTTRVWYAILKDDNDDFAHELSSFQPDFQSTIQKMITNQLPHEYARTLETGLWDNCEILPASETKRQGNELYF